MHDALTIQSRQQAAAFEHPRTRRIILDLISREQSLKELAVATGLSLSLLHYHLGRLRSIGLVEIAREESRPGRAVKRYRAAAARFFVPASLATDGTGETRARELRAGLDHARARRDETGIAYFVDDRGAHRMSRVQGPIKDVAFEAWIVLSLTPQDAERLSGDIKAVFARYGQPGKASARPVLAYCAFAETPRLTPARRRGSAHDLP